MAAFLASFSHLKDSSLYNLSKRGFFKRLFSHTINPSLKLNFHRTEVWEKISNYFTLNDCFSFNFQISVAMRLHFHIHVVHNSSLVSDEGLITSLFTCI